MTSETETDKALGIAEATRAAMLKTDAALAMLGISVDEVAPGWSKVSLDVRDDMVNGHDICHGGIIFTLADAAFAYACNSYNLVTVAAACDIAFVKPAHKGDRLTAIGEERDRWGRNGVYDIRVSNQRGETVALFRGHSRTIRGEVVPGLTGEAGGGA